MTTEELFNFFKRTDSAESFKFLFSKISFNFSIFYIFCFCLIMGVSCLLNDKFKIFGLIFLVFGVFSLVLSILKTFLDFKANNNDKSFFKNKKQDLIIFYFSNLITKKESKYAKTLNNNEEKIMPVLMKNEKNMFPFLLEQIEKNNISHSDIFSYLELSNTMNDHSDFLSFYFIYNYKNFNIKELDQILNNNMPYYYSNDSTFHKLIKQQRQKLLQKNINDF